MTIAYKEEVRDLTVWCQDNNISLNIRKRNKLIGDYRKRSAEPAPIHIYTSGAGHELQVPLCPHSHKIIVVHTHQQSREEGTICPAHLGGLKDLTWALRSFKMLCSCNIEHLD
jgi:hypothetical protein